MSAVRSVLIIDDSRLTRMMIAKIVTTHNPNWLITEAVDAEQAIALCQEQLFDYITLDHNMPGMTGLEAYPQLRASQQQARIGLFTANIQKSTQQRSEAAGLMFIPKPLSEDKVMTFFTE